MFKQEGGTGEFNAAMDDAQAGGGAGGEDDNLQIASAAEAMVQLSGFYGQQHDESMDVDPNYDPSDFLGNLREQKPAVPQHQQMEMGGMMMTPMSTYNQEDVKPVAAIHDDLAISDSDDEGAAGNNADLMIAQPVKMEEEAAGAIAMEPLPPQQQPMPIANISEPPKEEADDDLLWF